VELMMARLQELRPGEFARVAGTAAGYRIERNADENRIDHLNILVRADGFGVLEIALNTFSLRNWKAGFDGRVRVAVLSEPWNTLPPAGLSRSGGLDYDSLEAVHRIVYQQMDRQDLESLLTDKVNNALFIEAWGEFYKRVHLGIHQVHSRRASCAVSMDYLGHDGAVRFFKRNSVTDLLFFKFCGQL
jgi:hypothetical protein